MWTPLFISIKVAGIATLLAVVIGLALSFLLSRTFPGKALIEALVTAPLVLPPTVLGYYLLVLLGSQGPLGAFLEKNFGIELVFTWQGAVIAATVASLPLFVRTCLPALEAVDSGMLDAARTLGASEMKVFFSVMLPLAWRGVLAAIALAFARALGDFGTTLMVAGNIPGKTQTMPIAIYDAMVSGRSVQAAWLVGVITVVSIVILTILGSVGRRRLVT